MLAETVEKYPIARDLDTALPGTIVEANDRLGELTLFTDRARIVEVCRFLKEQRAFVRLSSVTALDWFPAEPRFEVVYHLHSLERNERLRLKCRVAGENPEIDSVTPVWRGANWYEREVFDMFGIHFRNHPDLKRILMPEDWEGHPLRKDYPVHGNKYSYQNE
jgi:NADH-quinone oxidoreductase subunit C